MALIFELGKLGIKRDIETAKLITPETDKKLRQALEIFNSSWQA